MPRAGPRLGEFAAIRDNVPGGAERVHQADTRDAGFSVQQATADEVVEMNLRTYGWADKVIFGTSPAAVEVSGRRRSRGRRVSSNRGCQSGRRGHC